MKRTLLLLIFIFLIVSRTLAQKEDRWDTYMASFNGSPGTVVLNMSLKTIAPIRRFPYVLVTGVTYKDCSSDGFPSKNEFNNLYAIEDSIGVFMKKQRPFELAGSFTHQCQRLNYYYVTDTTNLRIGLNDLYAGRFPGYHPYVNIKADINWKYYLDFLYPNEETQEFMANTKVVLGLSDAGDNLEKPRKVDHWLYFTTGADRTRFVEFAKRNGFKVEEMPVVKAGENRFALQISRTDKVDVESISRVTIQLRQEAKRIGAKYDGWETVVVK